jgi:[acyl-carrier-protein] S-malonyltransferase
MSNRDRITAIFPGQGGIQPGVGETAFNNSIEAKKIFYLASSEVGINLAEVAFGSETDRLMEQSQMVRTAASVAEDAYAQERGLKKIGAGGHSLGQLAAMASIEAIDRADIFAITRARQEAMRHSNEVNPGLMVAVSGIPVAIAHRVSAIAKARYTNENANDQHVFSGLIHVDRQHIKDRIEAALASLRDEVEELAKGEKKMPRIKIRPLGAETGAAHHPELQQPGLPILEEEVNMRKHRFNHIKPGVFLANSVQWLTTPDQIAAELLGGLTEGVNWRGQMHEYYASGYRNFYETESSDVLTGLINRDYVTKVMNRKFGSVVSILEPKVAASPDGNKQEL